jgi:multiple sugar transport system substrate-binding protein
VIREHTSMTRLTRRETVRLLGGMSVAALLSACGGATSTATTAPTPATGSGATTTTATTPQGGAAVTSTSSRAATSTGGVATGSPRAGGNAPFTPTIPDSGAQLPTEPVTFRLVDYGEPGQTFGKTFAPAYQRAHPNITFHYESLQNTDEAQVVAIGAQSGTAHDIFRQPNNVTAGQVVRQGWAAALDDVVPNFPQWKAAFPPNSFFEGINVFGGKTYSFPFLADKQYPGLICYNVDYLQRAGYDPQATPFTTETFRAAAKKVTEQGQGQYYGILIGGKTPLRWATLVNNFAQSAGAPTGQDGINWRTGEFVFTAAEYQAAIELLLAMKADGSFFPGSLSLNQQAAVAQLPTGVAAMSQANYSVVSVYFRQNPEVHFDLTPWPVPVGGVVRPFSTTINGVFYYIYAKTHQQAIAGDVISYLGSAAGQGAVQQATQGGLLMAFPAANEVADLDPRLRRAYTYSAQQVRLEPEPAVRNPDVAQVALEQRAVHPDLGETTVGLFTGQLHDPKAALKDSQDRSEAELARAIKAAQAKGAKVSRDDWKFPNWDPAKDYTEDDYKALKQ